MRIDLPQLNARARRLPTCMDRCGLKFALSCVRVLMFAALAVASTTRGLSAQFGLLKQGASATPATVVTATKVQPDSPRASYVNFVRLGRDGEWDKAALYLKLTREQAPRGAELAQRLRLVLGQRLNIALDSLSAASAGDTTDGSVSTDQIGTLVGPSGLPEAVLMTRVQDGGLARWVFAASTVNATDYWFSKLSPAWIGDWLPARLMREGPLQVFWWQWIGLLLAIPLLFLIALTISWMARAVFGRIVSRTTAVWDDHLVERLRGPFRLWVGAIAAGPVLALLELNTRLSGVLDATARGLVLIAFFWALLRATRLAQDHLVNAAWSHGQTQARTLVPLLGNFLRVTLVILALLIAMSQFGYPVSTLIGGLGIGGIAIALSAQKTVEHLFGSVSLAADKAFRVGDFVRVGTLEGTVERIGLRSTSFRTHERTIVRVPNGKLAEERIETFGARDRIFFRVDLGVTYDTSPEMLTHIRAEILDHLRREPKIWPDLVQVHVIGFGDSAINLRVSAWFMTTQYAEFLEIRNDVLMEFMRIIERHGSSFAFPTRTVHHVMEGAVPIPGSPPADIAPAP